MNSFYDRRRRGLKKFFKKSAAAVSKSVPWCWVGHALDIMLTFLNRRNKTTMFASVVFFYIGCIFTYSVTRLECTEASNMVKDELTDVLSKYEYAVLVISGPANEAKRDSIRTTWGTFTNNIFIENGEVLYKWNHTRRSIFSNVIKFYFVLGTQGLSESVISQLKKENSRSKDLLLLDSFEDKYENLATKMLYSLKWISTNMRGLKYVIKCDDDSFVRVDLIVKDLEAYAPTMNDATLSEYISFKNNLPSYKGLYWGYFNGKAKVFHTGKWKDTDWFLCNNYLPYALGGGYVISRSIVDYIARNSDFLSTYKSEDVSMGVWTASLDAINRVHDIRFDTQWKTRGCSNEMLIRHKQSPHDMLRLYKTLVQTRGEKLCNTETIEMQSYMYKWDTLPSNCCT